MSDATEVEVQEEESLTFEESVDFKNLLVVGMIAGTYDILGHKILLRTLSVAEDLAVGLIIKKYLGSNSYERAYKTAIVAAALREIDGVPFLGSISRASTDDLEELEKRFDKVKEYYPIFLDEVYNRFKKLEQKLLPLVSRLGKTSN